MLRPLRLLRMLRIPRGRGGGNIVLLMFCMTSLHIFEGRRAKTKGFKGNRGWAK